MIKLPGRKKTIRSLVILDLLSGEARAVPTFPFFVGAAGYCNWKTNAFGGFMSQSEWAFGFGLKDKQIVLFPQASANPTDVPRTTDLMLNDAALTQSQVLQPDQIVTLKVHGQLFAASWLENPTAWTQSVNTSSWVVFNGNSGAHLGSGAISQCSEIIAASGQAFDECLVLPEGLNASGFWVGHLPELLPRPDATPDPEPETVSVSATVAPVIDLGASDDFIDSATGKYNCPLCWKRFDGKDVKHVAVHPDLMGDEKLGAETMRRFVPTQWNDAGDPLDDFQTLAPEIACPHCHQRLPFGFLELPQMIFSLVGAPSSGKSYYLAILMKQMKRSLFKFFNLSFGDQDPEYNIELNDVMTTLFTASDPAKGRIIKTQLAGGLYKKVLRDGQEVELPQPYLYSLSRVDVEGGDKSLVFYDNAGEHFLPTYSRADEEYHILHVARASAIFFLYDPIANLEFRRKLKHEKQFNLEKTPDNQETILRQMNVKIKKNRGIAWKEKLDVPLAIMVGKCDVWKPMLEDWDRLENPIEQGRLNMAAVDRNSKRLRKFMLEMDSAIVSAAESISRDVRYFPVSAFGHKPLSVTDDQGTWIVPDPEKINPFMIEVPTLWALARVSGGLIPLEK